MNANASTGDGRALQPPVRPPTGPEDAGARYWLDRLAHADRHERAWRRRAARVVARYRDERERERRRVNILWSNTEILKPALYSQTPVPEVRRRFPDADPAGREAAEAIERALAFSIDDGGFDRALEAVRDDLLLAGRGAARVRLEGQPVRREVESSERGFVAGAEPVFEPERDASGRLFVEEVAEQRFSIAYVPWRDLRLSPARRWEEVWWVGHRHHWTRQDLEAEFGADGRAVALAGDGTAAAGAGAGEDGDRGTPWAAGGDEDARAAVWELWDKRSRRRLWLAEGHPRLLRVDPDPLGLEGFFDCPEPVRAVVTTDSMVPIPEFTLYQDQADELDRLTQRIDALIAACKVRGVYSAVSSAVGRMLEGEDNAMVPMEDLAAGVDQIDLRRLVLFLPLDAIAQALAHLYRQRELLKQEIFEITGLSDIVRGATKASETANAQRIKASFGSLRMTPRQRPLQRFIRDLFRLAGELVAEHATAETLTAMTGRALSAEALALLREDRVRRLRIDIETDSTVRPDMEAAQAEAIRYLEAAAGYISAVAPIVARAPEMAGFLLNAFKQASRRFKFSRELEDEIDEAVASLLSRLRTPPPPAGARVSGGPLPDAVPARPSAPAETPPALP